MIGFNSKIKKTQQLLSQSRQDFEFDNTNVRLRIMMAVNARHLSKVDARRLTFNPSTWPKYAFGSAIFLLAAIIMTSVMYAANNSKPGDALFSVQKFQNDVVLSLPLSETMKAQIGTDIVAKRLKELDEIQKHPTNTAQVKAEVKAVQASIDQAAKLVPQNSSDSTNKIIKQLNNLSTQHQEKLQRLSAQVQDNELKNEIQKSVDDITATQAKLLENRSGESVNGASTQDGQTQNRGRNRDRSRSGN